MSNAIKVGDRFIDEKGLVITVIKFNCWNTTTGAIFNLLFDNGLAASSIDSVEFFKDFYGPDKQKIIIKPFVLEEGKIYLTIEGYETHFKIITDYSGSKFYISDEDTHHSSDGCVILDDTGKRYLAIIGENNDYVKSVLQERKFKQSDFVDVKVIEQEAIPANSNPFHYDLSNMGTTLLRGWTIMHEGFCSEDNPQPANYLILVNTVSGQRIKLELSKRQ